MNKVKPKKHLGQHFLKDLNIARNIVNALTLHNSYKKVLEIGPGMGVLTDLLIKRTDFETFLIDLDHESVQYLKEKYPDIENRIIEGDFLKIDLRKLINSPFAIIGNFPYNISSQIFFKILEHRNDIPEVVCMLQKEVAERIASPPGNKTYGILSVLLQAYYNIDYMFIVGSHVFHPPPRVKSAVIRLRRNAIDKLDCNEDLFKKIVKQGFQNRRKTLRNALKPFNLADTLRNQTVFNNRAEQLSVKDFVDITKKLEANWK